MQLNGAETVAIYTGTDMPAAPKAALLRWLSCWWASVRAPRTPQLAEDQRVRVAERLRESTVTVLAGRSTGSGFVAPRTAGS